MILEIQTKSHLDSLSVHSFCYHCDLAIPSKLKLQLELDGQIRDFCCVGCLSVANIISSSGLDEFYRLRETRQIQPEIDTLATLDFGYLDDPSFVHPALERSEPYWRLSINLIGLSCTACAWLIEKYLSPQVHKVSVNQISQRAFIEFDPNQTMPSEILKSIYDLGYQGTLDRGLKAQELLKEVRQKSLMRLGVAAIGMMQVATYAIALHAGSLQGISDLQRDLMRQGALIVCTVLVFYSAKPFFDSAWSALKAKSLVMDVPVSIAISIAYGASLWSTMQGDLGSEVYFDSVAMFTFFLLLSRYLENRAREKLDLLPLNSLIPDLATLSSASGEKLRVVATLQLKLGDLILVSPGERIPADLKIISGTGDVDESILSGEFKPVLRNAGDELVAGSLNGESKFLGSVLRIGKDSSLSKVDRLYEQALAKRSVTQEFADRWAAVFIGAMLGISALTYIGWQFVDPNRALWVTLSVLVVSCPCALSLATPTSITAAMFALRQKGLLVRHTSALDNLKEVTDVVFDKTGTLTEGKAKVAKTLVPGNLSMEKCQSLAAGLESISTHPFAKAFVGFDAETLESCRLIAGGGIEGLWQNNGESETLRIGNKEFVSEFTADKFGGIETEDYAYIYLANEQRLLAVFHIEDPIRSSSQTTINSLAAKGLKLHILSGDPSVQTARIAKQLGVVSWRAGQSAENKVEYLEQIKTGGGKVLLVGDGINDVPAMAAADISLVVSQAPDLVQARADIGLMLSDLRLIPMLFIHSAKLSTVIRQNLAWAGIYNLSAIPAAAVGLIAPWMAAIGMSVSSLLVLMNALRLKRISLGSSGVANG